MKPPCRYLKHSSVFFFFKFRVIMNPYYRFRFDKRGHASQGGDSTRAAIGYFRVCLS